MDQPIKWLDDPPVRPGENVTVNLAEGAEQETSPTDLRQQIVMLLVATCGPDTKLRLLDAMAGNIQDQIEATWRR